LEVFYGENCNNANLGASIVMTAAPLTITPLFAAILGILYLALAVHVIRGRYQHRLSLGDGGNESFARCIRAHGNFAEYVPLSLLLMAFAELGGSSDTVVYGIGAALVLGRVLHAYALALTDNNLTLRRYGMILTFVSIVSGIGACLRVSLM